MSTPNDRSPRQDRIIAIAVSPPGWIARFIDEDADDGVWAQAVPVWALMADDAGHTWVAGIDMLGEGCQGRPCDEVGNFHDYVFEPDRALAVPPVRTQPPRASS